MSKFIRLFEKFFVILSLIVFTEPNALIEILVSEQNKIYYLQVLFLCLIGSITTVLIAIWRKTIIRSASKEKLLWFLLAIVLVSFFWSYQPLWTLVSSILLIQTTLFGVYFGLRYSLNEQLWLLAWAFGLTALFSFILGIVLPEYAIMGMGDILNSQEIGHRGSWQGIYRHKNTLGQVMSLGALVFLVLTKSNRKYLWLTYGGFFLCVSLLLLSTSKTALIVIVSVIMVAHLFKILQRRDSITLPLFIVIILFSISLTILMLGNAAGILKILGRDITLSGRTLLWAAVFDKICQRPWLGYGYGGFWRSWEGESADIWRLVGWEVPHAHNGFLDILLNLGLVGLIVFSLNYITIYSRAISFAHKSNSIERDWTLVFLIFFFLSNLTESLIFSQSIFWVLFVSCYFVCKQQVQSNRSSLIYP